MKTRTKLWAALVCCLAASATADSHAQFKVKETADNCARAHAILIASKSNRHDYIWRLISRVVRLRPYQWRVVDEYEPGVAQKVSFKQWDVKYSPGGTAYVAHCGYGGTCNSLAHAILKQYPKLGSPVVFCGRVPYILTNGQSVTLP